MTPTRLVIFAKAPLKGFAKTRLIPSIGEIGAELVAKSLLKLMLDNACSAHLDTVELCVSPKVQDPIWPTLGLCEQGINGPVIWEEQVAGDLGARLADGCERAIKRGESVMVTGTDCPGLTPEVLSLAAEKLVSHDLVIYPVSDGGYALLGVNQAVAPRLDQVMKGLFGNIPWSTADVFGKTMLAVDKLGLSCWVGAELHDVDEGEDIVHLPDNIRQKLQSL